MSDDDKFILSNKGTKYVKENFSVSATVEKLKKILLDLKKPTKEEQEEKATEQPLMLNDVLDDEGQENRIAVVLPESAGDILILNSLMDNLKNLYPEKNIYVFTKPEFYQMIDDNPNVH